MRKLKIETIHEEMGEVQYMLELSNDDTSASIEFYGSANEFKSFALGLISFPRNIKDKVTYELGKIGEKWAYYILLEVYCYEPNGLSAIRVVIHNSGSAPYFSKSEFFIRTLPASINALGHLLNNWNPGTTKEIVWMAE